MVATIAMTVIAFLGVVTSCLNGVRCGCPRHRDGNHASAYLKSSRVVFCLLVISSGHRVVETTAEVEMYRVYVEW